MINLRTLSIELNGKIVFLLFAIFWTICCLIINPVADFPLNDDWSYALSVKSLAVDGNLEYCGWMSMTLFFQVLWGSLFVKIFGFSFTVLRFSTIVLAFFGSWFTWRLFTELRIHSGMAFLYAAVISLNPIFLNLSMTFMTDVPFYTFAIASTFYLLRYMNTHKRGFLIAGIVLMCCAILIRQLGLAVPAGFFLFGIYRRKYFYTIPLLIGLLCFAVYQFSVPYFIEDLGRSNEINNLLLERVLQNPFQTLMDIIKRSIIFFIYFGLFFAPILIFLHMPKGKYVDWLWLVIALVSTYILFSVDFLMPLNKNILVDFGIGPRTLYDVHVTEETDLSTLPIFSRLQFTFIGLMFGLKVVEGVFRKVVWLRTTSFQRPNSYMVMICIGICYLIPIMAVDNFDRYYLFLFPIVVALIANYLTIRRTLWKGVQWVFMTTFLCMFTFLGNSYYFAWNRARWQGIEYLVNDLKVPTNRIDGGFEYNGWYNYNPDDFNDNVKNLWVPNDDYRICFESINGYEVIKEYPYREWLKFGSERTVKVLRKEGITE